MMAADELCTEHAAFRAEHIGSLHRVGEGGKLHGLVEKLDSDEVHPRGRRSSSMLCE
jgi:hypothetical protein